MLKIDLGITKMNSESVFLFLEKILSFRPLNNNCLIFEKKNYCDFEKRKK